MTHRILLFDIDGTLVSAGGAGRRSLEETFDDIYQSRECLQFSFAGMTDRLIMRRALTQLGQEPDDETIDSLIDAYVERLQGHVDEAEGYLVYDGVHAVLDEVSSWSNAAIGLGTGNIERGARIKLGRAGLNEYFAFGGFGCDAAERAALIRAGAERGARRLGRPLSACKVLVIGDTPRDVHAAHAIGADCLGVATGGASRQELDDAGANWTLDSLAGTAALELLARVHP